MAENLEERIITKLDLIFLSPENAKFIHPDSFLENEYGDGRGNKIYVSKSEVIGSKVMISLTLEGDDAKEKVLKTLDQALEMIQNLKKGEDHDLSHPVFEKQLEARFKYLYRAGKIQK